MSPLMHRTLRRLALVALAAALLVGGFAWGFLANRNGIFPFQLLRSLARQAGAEPPAPVTVTAAGADLALLEAVPYVGGTFDPDSGARDVLIHDPERAHQGLNLYAARDQGFAYLIDMDGQTVHRWTLPTPGFAHVELFPDGALLATRRGERIVKLDVRSKVLWSHAIGIHHDVWIDADGRIHTLVEEARLVPEIHPTAPVLDEKVVTFSPDGAIVGELSVLDIVLRSSYAFLLPEVSHLEFAAESAIDLLHNNHIEIFDGRLVAKSDLFAAGNFIVSLRNIHTIGIVDGETRELIWAWGPSNLTLQHQPTLLDNGHILIFNNGTEASQILELDPLSGEIVWLYEEPGEFFTRTRGSLQRLPNGNTLITESEPGYVFEVTPEGEKVWEFANPHVDDGIRGTIWRMTRIDPSEYPFLRSRQ